MTSRSNIALAALLTMAFFCLPSVCSTAVACDRGPALEEPACHSGPQLVADACCCSEQLTTESTTVVKRDRTLPAPANGPVEFVSVVAASLEVGTTRTPLRPPPAGARRAQLGVYLN